MIMSDVNIELCKGKVIKSTGHSSETERERERFLFFLTGFVGKSGQQSRGMLLLGGKENRYVAALMIRK